MRRHKNLGKLAPSTRIERIPMTSKLFCASSVTSTAANLNVDEAKAASYFTAIDFIVLISVK